MRKLFTPSTIIPCAIIAAVVAMVVSANVKEGRRSRRPFTTAAALGMPGAPATREGIEQRVSAMEAQLRKVPDDFGAAILLADALLRQSRVTGSAAPAVRAEEALRIALREDPGNYEALRMQASLLLTRHKFLDARTAAEKCRAMRPDDSVVYGILGDAHLELGDYKEAFAAFDRMMQLRPGPASYARVAYARELQGDLSGALESMKLAAEASSGGDVEGIAWYRSQVGELYLRLQRPHEAMLEFASASQAFPGHPFAVAGYAKALHASGRHGEARALLEDLVRKTPTPDLHVQLGDLFAAAGRREDADRHYALAEAGWRSDAPEPKNLARFLADRGEKLDEAVAIAEDAHALRNDIFTQDALAWAYFKAGRIDEARHMIYLARRTGTRDADILRHAKAIEGVPSLVARK
jgi:predicted Zn-dependent protease